MTTTEQEYVVCGEHSILYSAAGRCPNCSESVWGGAKYDTARQVEVVEVGR